ncbi:MAG: hypothetical protein EOP87_11455 [Verrucomicrobiaceae bacterium]|nr:MAG: hypothetical protein EOP87_11455 [Verrucomicrobiaceae bacterium]
MIRTAAWLFPLALALPLAAREALPFPAELAAIYKLDAAPVTESPLLKTGDRLAICGDSITEQRLYSVLLETYLRACCPELEVTCRQYGWSGEQAGGFLGRMESDVLRFKPTVATTCYGMNDFRYVPFDPAIGAEYKKNETAVVKAFQAAGCKVVVGSPGIIDSVPHWVKSAAGTQQDLNISLSRFRNIAAEVAEETQSQFADTWQEMAVADHTAKKQFGPDFKVSGKDGVHPAWAGQVVMAYGFLKALGMDGNLGSITYDAASSKAVGSDGHEVQDSMNNRIVVLSQRLPFAPGPGVLDKDDSLRAGMALVPFDDELNRFTFRMTSPTATSYTITWGEQSRTYPAAELEKGINLAKDFDNNPLVPAMKKVWDAVAKKQEYETRQIKELVHGPEGAADRDATFALTEKARAPLARAVQDSFVSVIHEITVKAAP